jgi:hypothetical protein
LSDTLVVLPEISKQNTRAAATGRVTLLSAALLAPLVTVFFGCLISVLPHLVWGGVWIADNDELLYLSYAGHSYFDHPGYLEDSATLTSQPTFYPWLQMVPGILVAKLLALGPLGISVIWRIWAGISIAIGWYLLTKLYTRSSWGAAAMTTFLLADVGVLTARPLVRQFLVSIQVLLGQAHGVLDTNPMIHPEWRIITPSMSLSYLLLHMWLTGRAREIPNRTRIVFAGLGFGILFYAYFYYWTAAALALGIVLLLDKGMRRVYLGIACIGTLVGLPALASAFFLKKLATPDWLNRTELGLHVPRFSEFLVPKGALLLLAVLFVWIWWRRKDLIYIWALAVAALLLLNHQVLTSIQMQNFHWTYVWGPCLTFLMAMAATDWIISFNSSKKSGLLRLGLGLIIVVHLTAGLWLRAVEAKQTQESVGFTTDYLEYREQQTRFARIGMAPHAVIAGDKDFVDLATILNDAHPLNHYAVVMSPWVNNSEWDYRIALNGFLRGLDRQAFVQEEKNTLATWVWGPEARDPERRAEQLADRLKGYDRIAANPAVAIERFKVKYVALRKSNEPSPQYLRSGWREIEDGRYWEVWERE